jgi:hypothetical protein
MMSCAVNYAKPLGSKVGDENRAYNMVRTLFDPVIPPNSGLALPDPSFKERRPAGI